ncbi:AAA family ATPase [Tissierella praeacuta]|uniref:AAA family ATPase n=1 Tax=Tissierella praeacuta TaxID=43131 RepID=UPI00333F48CB
MEALLNKIMSEYDSKETIIIGIDGLGGAGKSTITELLKTQLQNINYYPVVLHIDDFIHPKHIRYDESKEEWYCYYNIQWRYDYLIKEVLLPIKQGIEIYKEIELYNKENDLYILEQIRIPHGSILLIEGIFLQRKELERYFDYMIYVEVPKETRFTRVINRDTYIGEAKDIKLKYERRYFPAENKYIKEYCPIENADFVLDNI